VGYKYVELEDGVMKRKRIIKKHVRKWKRLTQEQKDEIDHAFMMFDKDRSNSIDLGELKDAMKALGVHLLRDELREKME